MFWIGAAPTVPGISARFSSPAVRYHRVGGEAVPRFARAGRDGVDGASVQGRPADLHAGNLHQQHQAVEVAREHDVAAAAQHQHRQAPRAGIGQCLGNVLRCVHVRGIAGGGLETERVVPA